MQNTSTNASKVELSIKSNALHMKIFPKASFGNSHALTDFNLLKIWRLIMLAHIHLKPEPYHKASFWYFYCFKCEACTYITNLFGVLKNHINCIHASKFELSPMGNISIILYVNFALKLSVLVREWGTI